MGDKYIPRAKEDIYALIEEAQKGNEQAKEQIILDNTGLVRKAAFKFASMGYEAEDLVQIGFIGLIKAVERFNTEFDVMFSTYAVPMIMGEIRKYIRDDGRIKVSRQIKQDIRRMKLDEEEFYRSEGRSPKITELAERMGTSCEYILQMQEAEDALVNIESLDNENRPEDICEAYAHEEEKNIDIIQLKGIIGSLPLRERQVIVLRYFRDTTQDQTAKVIGVSQVQVSRIEKRVLARMREEFEEQVI